MGRVDLFLLVMNSHAQDIRIVQFLHPPNVIILEKRTRRIEPFFQCVIILVVSMDILLDILFSLTRICNDICKLHLQLLDRFLLSTTHGECELLWNYNEIMRRYCHLHRGAMVGAASIMRAEVGILFWSTTERRKKKRR